MLPVMVLFGSGGHSTEMMMLLRNARMPEKLADEDNIDKLICVISDDDCFIQDTLNEQFFNSYHKFDTIRMKRPRAVKQSYLTSIWTFLIVLHYSFCLIREHQPKLLLTNGPGLSVTVALAIRFMQLFKWGYKCHVLYVESFCRTKTLSLSGRILYHLRLADDVYVQWPEVAKNYPRSKYDGILV